jgi:hypothetical protein
VAEKARMTRMANFLLLIMTAGLVTGCLDFRVRTFVHGVSHVGQWHDGMRRKHLLADL